MADSGAITTAPPQIPEGLKKKRGQKSRGLAQAQAIQDFTFEALMALRNGLLSKTSGKLKRVGKDTAKAITDLCRANDAAQDRIRIHRGIPLPGSLKQAPQRQKRTANRTLQPQAVVSGGGQGSPIVPILKAVEPERVSSSA